jgi:hypothetical protein
MPKTLRVTTSADEIADRASRGEDISAYFTNKFTVVCPAVHADAALPPAMVRKLDAHAAETGLSRQAVIKKLLSQALDGVTVRPSARKRRDR